MKHIKIIALSFVLSLFSIGCSTMPTQMSSGMNAETKKYVQNISPTRVDAATRTSCPAAIDSKAKWTDIASAANACAKAGQWSKVEEYGELLAKTEFHSPWGPYYLSLAASERGDLLRATWMLDLATKKAPQVGLFQYQRGRLFYLNKDIPGAVAAFNKAVDMDSQLYEANLYLGQIYYQNYDYDRAVPQFKAVLKAEPQNRLALEGLGESYTQKNDGSHAAEVYAQAVYHFPEELEYRLRLAQIYEKMTNSPEKALDVYKNAQFFIETRRIKTSNPRIVTDKIKALELAIQKSDKNAVAKASSVDRSTASQSVQSGGKK